MGSVVEDKTSLSYTGKQTKHKIEVNKSQKKKVQTGTLDKNKFSIFGNVELDKKHNERRKSSRGITLEANLKHWQKQRTVKKELEPKETKSVSKRVLKPPKLEVSDPVEKQTKPVSKSVRKLLLDDDDDEVKNKNATKSVDKNSSALKNDISTSKDLKSVVESAPQEVNKESRNTGKNEEKKIPGNNEKKASEVENEKSEKESEICEKKEKFICNLIAAGNQFKQGAIIEKNRARLNIDEKEYDRRLENSDNWMYIAHGYEKQDPNSSGWISHAQGTTLKVFRPNEEDITKDDLPHSMYFVNNLMKELERYSDRWQDFLKTS